MPKDILNKLKSLPQNKLTLGLVVAVVLIIIGGFFVVKKISSTSPQSDQVVQEVDLPFDPEGPYAILSPRRDGNALVLDLKRTASYDKISYELAYQSEGIDRGVVGEIDTSDKKSEYNQEILFGTCSKNVCKYDTGVENGTLTLHIQKGNEAYRMITQWHLQTPSVALGVLTSGDSHFTYKLDQKKNDLSLILFTIVNDLSGAPKLPQDKDVVGKVYSINTPVGQNLPAGNVSIELSSSPSAQTRLSWFDEKQDKWQDLNAKISGSSLVADAPSSGIFAVLAPKK